MSLLVRVGVDAGALLLALGLGAVLLWPGVASEGLGEAVATAMPESGVKHPVTAVLLNFRGYDTLLEMLVLLLALIGVRSLGELPVSVAPDSPSPVLEELLQLLFPVLLLVSIYLLWRGSSGPGGAFQAGAVLGAAGVLWLLAGRPTNQLPDNRAVRPLLVTGVGFFAIAGMAFAVTEGAFLAYPGARAGTLIFAIEALATVSIAATLLVLFVGAPASDE
jgi:multisubunit Na+/H+ antiporter MnhB subunit